VWLMSTQTVVDLERFHNVFIRNVWLSVSGGRFPDEFMNNPEEWPELENPYLALGRSSQILTLP
jgi:hypothetical protein